MSTLQELRMANLCVSGRIKSFDAQRGFGFIIGDDTKEEVFVHKSAIAMDRPLNAGDAVEFNIVTDWKGASAENVWKLETRNWYREGQRKQYLAKDVSGKVKSFDAQRGFGFIVRDDTREDVFVHKSAIVVKSKIEISRPLKAGDQVVFNVVSGQKGPEASYVTQKLETTENRGQRKHYLAKDVSGKVKYFALLSHLLA